ncbi:MULTISPECIES: heme biosynthesis HemY N-terminal domain-containing protein [unclassified Lysobacter]|uniref:heme biosynthesis HemY N-terminal domain-containing protein n=1 Tax=unclassified Lysobacter TaxID=2635362 RepID=UPI001BE7DF98|nr:MULTISPECIES: heme biosynthesis HemY N-terminal domain-containing protein [unclassified Lysobacter]MBT2745739.1 heme biosynthesis protein HemY [Lysobacter sp. ISL-42]MBT2749702.1 heme biosynthesis protein HemY [Lysobacter sp. ISL-50]MBT2777579.1 heme biosynthesis protein HemY [Lysobacter sp. ISL-54]MBT2782067.1 heme biosynthesis protein HemY [Lysobacter sp. ISL-52]
MNLFRNLLFWIVLALVGALAAQLLVQDPGKVVVTYGGVNYLTNLPKALLMLIGALLALWLVWKVLSLPFVAMRRRRKKQARARLIDGLDALHQGHWSRAEKSLALAASNRDVAAIAGIGAARAAAARGDAAAQAQHLDALADDHPVARALTVAELALSEQRPADALAALDAPNAQPLPPRGLALRAQALAALGRAGEAYGLLGSLRQQNAWPADQLSRLEAAWAEAALREAADANVLADHWERLPKPLKTDPAAVAAYAERAAALRWEEAAAKSLEQALDARWDESLAALYGRLPIGRLDARRTQAERWLATHSGSPGLLLSLARIARAQGQWPQAEAYLHRALAQGAHSEAWEELGHGFAQVGDESRARLSYLNALRAARGEATTELPGRDLRQKLFDEAVTEERDEFGMPRLRG